MPVTERYYRDLLAPLIASRRWIVAQHVLAGAASVAAEIEQLGGEPCLVIAGQRGIGPIRDESRAVVLGLRTSSLMDGMRAADRAFEQPYPEVTAAIEAFDPAAQAVVVRDLLSAPTPICGRRVYGARDPRWIALEDKTAIDAFWDAAGIARAPSAVLSLHADRAAVAAAALELDAGLGTVWAGDSRDGVHGAASLLHWVRDEEQARRARELLADRCDRVRVMPFLDGIPCSIHGIVFDDYVAALRPCEMLVLRRPGRSELLYASGDTFWDPPPSERDAMRAAARRVGERLRATVGFRGCFTLDGVLTHAGFLPTELNPRFGAAVELVTAGLPELPIYVMALAIAAGERLDWRPDELEELIVSRADAHRSGKVGAVVDGELAEPVEERLVFESGAYRRAHGREAHDGVLVVGPSAGGLYVRLTPVADRVPRGPSFAPHAVAALAYVRSAHGVEIGPLAAAPDMHPVPGAIT